MGIPIYIDAEHAIAHNKIMVIDKETVITGSFNFTKAAEESNAENLLILSSKEVAKAYNELPRSRADKVSRNGREVLPRCRASRNPLIENWNKHREHSKEYKGR